MEVIKCNTEVAIETLGEAPNLSTKSKMAENRFKFASTDAIVVDQLKLNAENKNTTKLIQTWVYLWEKWANERKFNHKLEEYEHEDLDKKLQLFYAEVYAEDGFFYNFVENITNNKCNDRSCISRYMVTRDAFKVFKLNSPAARAILRTLSLVPIYHEMHSRSYDFHTKCYFKVENASTYRKAPLTRKCYKGRKCDIKVESVIMIENAAHVKISNITLT